MFTAARNTPNPDTASAARKRGPGTGTTRLAALLLASTLTVGLGVGVASTAIAIAPTARTAAPHPARLEQRYAEAVQAFQAQRYSAAYGRFAALADEGHAPAALMALALVRYAPMFGAEWSATPAQMEDWSALAMQDMRVAGALIARHRSRRVIDRQPARGLAAVARTARHCLLRAYAVTRPVERSTRVHPMEAIMLKALPCTHTSRPRPPAPGGSTRSNSASGPAGNRRRRRLRVRRRHRVLPLSDAERRHVESEPGVLAGRRTSSAKSPNCKARGVELRGLRHAGRARSRTAS